MNFKILAEFKTPDYLVQLVADTFTKGDYIVFQRFENNSDLDNVDPFYSKQFAYAKFEILVKKALIELCK